MCFPFSSNICLPRGGRCPRWAVSFMSQGACSVLPFTSHTKHRQWSLSFVEWMKPQFLFHFGAKIISSKPYFQFHKEIKSDSKGQYLKIIPSCSDVYREMHLPSQKQLWHDGRVAGDDIRVFRGILRKILWAPTPKQTEPQGSDNIKFSIITGNKDMEKHYSHVEGL